mmetsp:Transcript_17496/g.36905  ORF Transcript_17496/g.36905 Transcript_17496/m.36905 type:complete len:247 (+) Transcript_17496:638-1378(+)
MILGEAEHFADDAGGFANVFVDDGGGDDLEEGGLDVGGEGAGEKGFAGARWAVEEDSFGCLDAHPHEQLRIRQRQFNHLPQLPNLFVQSTNIAKADLLSALPLFLRTLHVKHRRINLAGQYPHDGEGSHIQRHAGTRLELLVVQSGSTSHHITWTARCLDNETIVIQSLQDIANDLTHRLKGRQIVLRLLIPCHEALDILAHALEAGFHFAMFADFGAVLFEDLLSLRWGGGGSGWCGHGEAVGKG